MERILIVDDDPSNLSMLRRVLRVYRYDLSFADNGGEALEKARSFAPDLVILDIMMEGMDGYEVCRRIKDNPETAQTMVLLLSGKSGLADRLKGYEQKADDFLAKPFDHEELLARVSILLRLKSAIDKARAAEKRKDAFLAVMSHEIRNPLGGMIGMLELLETEHLSDDQKDAVRSVRSNADSLLGLIDGILDFSKLEAGKTELSSSDFNLFAVLDDLNDILAVKAGKKGVNYGCIVDSDVPLELNGDVGRLRQILLNLGGNAVKFTETGDVCIHISVEKCEGDHITMRFQVSDSGIGIAPDALAGLFQKYHQADKTISGRFGGTGLGLSISRDLARLMGGDITVKSLEGKGSEFTATLCFTIKDNRNHTGVEAGKIRLLNADPNGVSRKALEELCKRWQWEFKGVSTCSDAKAEMADGGYNALLVSDDLPDRDRMTRSCVEGAIARSVTVGRVVSYGQTPKAGIDQDAIASVFFRPVKPRRLKEWLIGTGFKPQIRPIAPVEPLQGGLRVLLADDNDMSLRVTERMLRKLGCAVTTALNGKEALEAYFREDFDLIFMDSRMPDMDGLEATRQIRLSESSETNTVDPGPQKRVPIIALTGESKEKDMAKFIQAGADDFAVKPITLSRLKDIVEKNAF